MANASQTTGELFKVKVLNEADLTAAVNAFMADSGTTAFHFGDGYRLDLAEAVRAHEWASVTTTNREATDHLKRAAVRTAILLARPEKT